MNYLIYRKLLIIKILILTIFCSCTIEKKVDDNCELAIKEIKDKEIIETDSCLMYFGHGYDSTKIKLIIDKYIVFDTILFPNIMKEANYNKKIIFERNKEVKIIVDGKCFIIPNEIKSYFMKVDYFRDSIFIWNYNKEEVMQWAGSH